MQWRTFPPALHPPHPPHALHSSPHTTPQTRTHRVQLHGQAGEGVAGDGGSHAAGQQAPHRVDQVVEGGVGIILVQSGECARARVCVLYVLMDVCLRSWAGGAEHCMVADAQIMRAYRPGCCVFSSEADAHDPPPGSPPLASPAGLPAGRCVGGTCRAPRRRAWAARWRGPDCLGSGGEGRTLNQEAVH